MAGCDSIVIVSYNQTEFDRQRTNWQLPRMTTGLLIFLAVPAPKNQTAPLFGGAALVEVRGRSTLGLERLHVFSLEAFRAIHQVELHGLAFLQAAESV